MISVPLWWETYILGFIDFEIKQIEELYSALGPLDNHHQKLYCSEACLRRYLQARNWNVKKAKHMLQETLKWRKSYKPEDIRWVMSYFSFLYTLILLFSQQDCNKMFWKHYTYTWCQVFHASNQHFFVYVLYTFTRT